MEKKLVSSMSWSLESSIWVIGHIKYSMVWVYLLPQARKRLKIVWHQKPLEY